MRSAAELRGLRYPDVYIVRMLFKEGLHLKPGRVLELGCGSGNNLIPFADFGWEVTGVDVSAEALADARHNLAGVGTFIECDLATQFAVPEDAAFEVVLLPQIIYYLPRQSCIRLLQECRRRLVPGGVLFVSSRVPEDWRFGRGSLEERGAYRLDCHETGEFGLLNVFYSADELLELLRTHMGGLGEVQRLAVTYDNPQSGIVVHNAEVVIWGRIGGA